MIDCLIIGGGPAGLTAAVYLARFRRTVTVIDGGNSRASKIPFSHNIPGIAEGISGDAILARHREQALAFGVEPVRGTVTSLARHPQDGFAAEVRLDGDRRIAVAARTVLMATGVRDREPTLPDVKQAILDGYVRHCPVCDAYEVIDQNIGVIGRGRGAVGEALFMRTYSDRITLLTLGEEMNLTTEDRSMLQRTGIAVMEEPIAAVTITGNRITALSMAGGRDLAFDTIYSALGADAQTSLTDALGADHDTACHAVVVDHHQRSTVPGIWAAGDIVSSLNQVAVAWGQATIAATDIHNHLRKAEGTAFDD